MNFGKPAFGNTGSSFGGKSGAFSSMLVDTSKVTEQQKEFKAPLQTLSGISTTPDQLLDAYKPCFTQQSFKSQFYNIQGENFEQVTCEGYANLQKKSEFQLKELDLSKQMVELLYKQTNKINEQKRQNDALMTDLIQRQLVINMALVQVLSKDSKHIVDNEQLQDLQKKLNIQTGLQTFAGQQLLVHLQNQAAVIAEILAVLQYKGIM
ncbi:Hypothetical_protein [Hexamita inflata]|uniref:Hypothetical_protein n=1 Tax=Hexamita inflata TaxID=28002 RepID=A0AA86UBP5_9EUKA|nr:Hypothetical protein HINF_LOCUS33706 [Hexamita inflata]